MAEPRTVEFAILVEEFALGEDSELEVGMVGEICKHLLYTIKRIRVEGEELSAEFHYSVYTLASDSAFCHSVGIFNQREHEGFYTKSEKRHVGTLCGKEVFLDLVGSDAIVR